MSAAHDIHDSHSGAAHGSLKSYLVGFLLALILTVIPFWLVMTGAASAGALLPAIMAIGAVQMVVHLVFFLHLNGSSSQRWNVMALLLTVLIVAIVVVGSLWVIYQSNVNMMPWMHMAPGAHTHSMPGMS